MWKNWIPFRKKEKEEVKKEIPRDQDTGKENEADANPRFQNDDNKAVTTRGPPQSFTPLTNYGTRDQQSFGDKSCHTSSSDCNNSSFSVWQKQHYHNGERESNGRKNDKNLSSANSISSGSCRKRVDNAGANDSFSTVHGPLLSTPIMPKVRRVIETQSGLRSAADRSSLLARGRPVGRSASMNYKSSNPVKSTAGQVPWVRLKRRESIALADIVRGKAPHSPNTIKIASPEPSHLLPAPSFKVTPLIVTTEASRGRVIDTQTVVSALREKRKRIAGSQADDIVSDDATWLTSAKRRRQDSSQSNASSVSIPPMPDALPNLIGVSETSMLHMENMVIPRPSTVPSIDAYVSRHIHNVGLGGEHLANMQRPRLTQQYHQPHSASSKNSSSKHTQRALQSSLSSSLRARNNLSLLERGGIDLSRLRSNSFGSSSNRRTSFSSDVSMLDKSVDMSQAGSRQLSPVSSNESAPTGDSLQSTQASTSPNSAQSFVSTVSAPTKRKIAEGVMLRKQNLSINSSNSPHRTPKPVACGIVVGTQDLEQDRNKEYQRRVLDLLSNEDDNPKSTAASVTFGGKPLTSIAASSSGPSTSPLASSTLAASSAATSAAVSASLDSLNKLVQSTPQNVDKAAVSKPLTSPASASLSQPSVSSLGGFSLTSTTTSEADASSNKPSPTVTCSLLSSMLSKENAPTLSSTPAGSTSAMTSGLSVGLSSPSLSSAAGFQVNFGNISTSVSLGASSSSSSTPTVSSVPGSSAPPPYNFGTGSSSVASSATSPLSASNQGQVTVRPTNLTSAAPQIPNVSFGAVSASSGLVSNFGSQMSSATTPVASSQQTAQLPPAMPILPAFSFGSQSAQQTIGQAATASLPTPGGFNFGLTTMTSTSTALNPTMSSGTSQQPAASNAVRFGVPSSSAGSQPPGNQGTVAAAPSGGFNFNASAGTGSGMGGSSVGGITFPGSVAATQFSAQPTSMTQASAPLAFSTSSASAATLAPQMGPQTSAIFGSAATPSSNVAQAAPVAGQNFNFGRTHPQLTAAAPMSATAAAQSSTPFAGSAGQPNPAGGFNFGVQSTSSAPATKNLFQFGAAPASTASASVFGSTAVVSMPSAGLNFGGTANAGVNPQPAFPAASVSSTPSTTFGGPASGFGPGSGFGTAPAATSAQIFGATSNSGFNPGTTSSGSQPSTFGQSTSANTAFVFGAQTSTTSQPPAFGSTVSSPFGASSAATTSAPTIFGSNPSATNAAPFGSTTASGVSVFGAQNTSANPTSPPSIFGSSANAPGFGAAQTSQPAGFGTGPTTQTNIFVSGTATQPSIFGSGGSSQPNAFGATPGAQSPSFGSAPTTQPSVFGSGPTPQAPVFGSGPMPQAPAFGSGPTPQAPAFGSGTASQPSVFGSAGQAPGTASQPSVFGSTGQAPFGSVQTTAQPTAFGTGQTTQPTAFGTGQTQQPAAFGGVSNAFGAASPSAPAFGTPSQPSAPAFGAMTQNEAKPAFGTATTASVSVFGAPKANNPFNSAGPASGGAFAFNAGQMGQNTAASNPFNATATSSASTGFNFKSPTGQAANPPGGFNFSPQVPQQSFQASAPRPPAGGFNFSAAAPGASNFNFSATPNNAVNTFTPQAPGNVHRPRAVGRRMTRRGTRR